MKILHTVENYYPSVGGMQEVVKQISERLAAKGHEVTIATKKNSLRTELVHNKVRIVEFDCSGFAARNLTGETEAYKNFLLNSDFDIMVNFAAQNFATDVALPLLEKIKAKKVFVPTGFSMLHNPVYSSYYDNMKLWMKQYDMNVFLSDDYRDINFARENGIRNTILIPNGADEREFLSDSKISIRKKLNIPEDAFFILHVGSFTGYKGQLEAFEIYLSSTIKNGYLLFIGNDFEEIKRKPGFFVRWMYLKLINILKRKKVNVKFLKREDVVDAYKSADLFLFPSNIECSPIVLFECMAAHLPYMTTDVGNAKEIISWCNSGVLLPTTIDEHGYSHANVPSSAIELSKLANDKEKLSKMAKAGYDAWQKNFSWEKISNQYEDLYLSLLKEK